LNKKSYSEEILNFLDVGCFVIFNDRTNNSHGSFVLFTVRLDDVLLPRIPIDVEENWSIPMVCLMFYCDVLDELTGTEMDAA
jgi:hypothetical protein